MGPLEVQPSKAGASLQKEESYLRQALGFYSLTLLPIQFLLPKCGCNVIGQLPTPAAVPSPLWWVRDAANLEL